MKIKTSELTGAALDWAVATCEGHPVARHSTGAVYLIDTPWSDKSRVKWLAEFGPRKHWAQGGPIIEREGIAVDCIRCDGKIDGWIAALPMICEAKYEEPAPTALIAAMRCFVASRLGDEVDIPDELC